MEPEPKIGEFLIRISEDPDAFFRDPEKALAESGLTPEQQDIIRSGDIRRIQEAVRAEYPDRDLFFITWAPVKWPVHIVDY